MCSVYRMGWTRFQIVLSCHLARPQLRGLSTSHFLFGERLMKNVEDSPTKRMVDVTWKDDTSHRYPYIYLRDNCPCSKCFFKESSQRLLDVVRDVDINIKPDKVEMSDDGAKLSVAWPDGHVSLLDSDWLFEKRLADEVKPPDFAEVTTRNVVLWGNEFKERIPRLKFHDILSDEEVQFDWLNSLYRYGVMLITDTPVQEGQLDKLGELVGYLRMTAYGKTTLVSTRQKVNSVAYTTYTLPFHSDLPYYECKPGIQMLFCLEQIPTEGGENSLVDSFNVAQQLKKEDPQAYDLLTNTHVLFRTKGADILGDYDFEGARPILEVDHLGRLLRCNLNEGTRECFLGVTADKTQEMYEAYYSFCKRLTDPKNMILHKLSPGEIVVFDNDRVLHGRTGYTLAEGMGRCLESTYIDWDVARSKLNVLGRKLKKGPVARMDSNRSVVGQWTTA
ncbi:PREDICTED: gamma-butyrobetaine dioxygenase-like [Acropora digitifera]|uniref:gamma-butyrobetaine dioxygenase-like n=1 Tax=Acropora digitifera TaxID=70779 RepID=UPI00077B1D48|nr:PREDICTED: gamma-butyrobetaine dioxygenase-like [Acropora digitifera]